MKKQWDVITLRGLSAIGHHGVHDFERLGSQVFTADLELFVDARVAAETDDVENTVDYSEMAERAVAILSGPPVYLIETLASNLADMALAFPLVQRVKATVHKPMAPVHHKFEDVSVSVIRARDTQKAQQPAVVAASVAETNLTEDAPEMDRPAQLASQQIEPPAPPVAPRTFPTAKVQVREVSVPAPPPKPVRRRRDMPHAAPIRSRKRAPLAIPRSFTDGSPVYNVVLALGSNRGESLRIFSECVLTLSETEGIEIDAVSPVVRTLPVLDPGAFPQKDYLNAVVLARTVLPPPVLLQALQQIEHQFGRTRIGKWSPRSLDIDIVDIDGMELETRDLTLPHPRAHQRAFVLYPWSKVAPEATLPSKGRVTELLKNAPDLQGLLSVRDRWLGEGGQVLEGTEVTLNERPVNRPKALGSKLPTVQVRGENLRLADVADDPIFQRVLKKEMAATAPVPVVGSLPAPVPVQAPVAEQLPEPLPVPVVEQLPESLPVPVVESLPVPVPVVEQVPESLPVPAPMGSPPAPQAQSQAPLPIPVPAAVPPEMLPALPDWRSGARQQSPRVIEDYSCTPTPARPITVPVRPRGRRVTVRPTPTGAIPVVPRKREEARG